MNIVGFLKFTAQNNSLPTLHDSKDHLISEPPRYF